MSRKVMSVKGEIVDFDLFAVKSAIANKPKPDDAKNRERFIDKKRRRSSRGSVDQLLAQQQQAQAAVREALAKQKAAEAAVGASGATEAQPEVSSSEPSYSPPEAIPEATQVKRQVIRKKQ